MQLVSARDLLAEAPADLQALRLVERSGSTSSARRLFAVGDVGFCGRLADPHGVDPWRDLGPILRTGDMVFANLETPLVPEPVAQGLPFVAPISTAPNLADAGFNIVSLANNHIADAGPAGISSTLDALGRSGVAAVGAGSDAESAKRLQLTDLGDLTIGWLACGRTHQEQAAEGSKFWELEAAALLAAVRDSRPRVDILVVSLHLGYMFVDYPHPDHRHLTLELVAEGADLVLCHHAHVLQGIETVQGADGRLGAICHNLGNFLFDWTVGDVQVKSWIEEQRCGAVVLADFDREGLCRLAVLPTRVDDDLVVRWAVGETGRSVLDRLRRLSEDLQGDFAVKFRSQRAQRNTALALRSMARSLCRGEVWPVLSMLPRLRGHHLAMVLRWLVRRLSWKTDG